MSENTRDSVVVMWDSARTIIERCAAIEAENARLVSDNRRLGAELDIVKGRMLARRELVRSIEDADDEGKKRLLEIHGEQLKAWDSFFDGDDITVGEAERVRNRFAKSLRTKTRLSKRTSK